MSFTVKCEKRDAFGKNASRRIRRGGKIPAILYGSTIQSIPLILAKKDIVQILKSEAGENTIFKVSFDSGLKDAMIKDVQVDPATDELLHADLIQIEMDKPIRVSVPLVLVGEAIGVKAEGGFVDFITREVEIECLPKDIPERLEVDISALHLNQSIKVENVTVPRGVKFISDANTVLVLIEVPHKEEVAAAEKVEEVVEEAKEPEVIKKERPAEEKEEEK